MRRLLLVHSTFGSVRERIFSFLRRVPELFLRRILAQEEQWNEKSVSSDLLRYVVVSILISRLETFTVSQWIII